MFWKKQKKINKLTIENAELEEKIDDLIKEQEEREKYTKNLEKDKHRLTVENEKLCQCIKEYGDFKIEDISIPFHIAKRETNKFNNYSGEKMTKVTEVTKIIPQIIVHYFEEE